MRILVLQPNVRTSEGLVRYLRSRGHQVWASDTLAKARAEWETLCPDLVFLDLHFPGNAWLDFLRFVRQEHPNVRLILTSQHPDLQREMQARSYGASNFLRQPFTPRWIEIALRRSEGVGAPTQPSMRRPATTTAPSARFPMRLKIILPYLLLAFFFSLAAAYIVTQVVYESVQERFLNQLLEAGQRAQNWMVSEENRLLTSLRLVANSEGIAEALQAGDAESLRLRLLPIAVNTNEESISLLNGQGMAVLTLYRQPGDAPGDYRAVRDDPVFQRVGFVQNVLHGLSDAQGDKFAGYLRVPWGDYFFVSGPLFDAQGQRIGAVVVGRSLHSLARAMRESVFGDISLYDFNGEPLTTTLYAPDAPSSLGPEEIAQALVYQDRQSLTRTFAIGNITYSELLLPWEARAGEDIGVLGVALPQSFVIRTSQATRLQIFLLLVGAIGLVILIGVYLASLITRPLAQLVHASEQVA